MIKCSKKLALFIAVICISALAFAQDKPPTGTEIIEHMTAVLTPDNSKGSMRQSIITSTGKTRSFEFDMYSGNRGEKNLMIYTAPAAVRGQAFLMLNNADDIWTYFPRTNRTRKLASSAKNQKVQGSDFTYDDLGSGDSWRTEYFSENQGAETFADVKCWKVRSDGIPDKDPAYFRIMIWVRQSDFYPLKMDYYENDGKVAKSLFFEDIQMIEDYPTAMRMVMQNNEKGTETSMETLAITYTWKPARDFFSERSLKR
jgi:outer membrane lipoprotein-sorting protein